MTTHRSVPGLVIAVLVTVALTSVALTVVGFRRDPAPQVARASDPAPGAATQRPEVDAAAVLAAWDADRAAAWAAGDVRRLRSLYTRGSVAGERDAAMLRRWVDRGLVVRGLRMQVLSLDEVSRTPQRWVLSVVDRVVGVRAGGGLPLPSDTASARVVVLRRVVDEWLVAAVRDHAVVHIEGSTPILPSDSQTLLGGRAPRPSLAIHRS